MTTTVSVAETIRKEIADLISVDLNSGYINIYTGTMPATIDDANTNTKLAELRFAATSAPASTDGSLIFNTITGEDSILADGTATFYRTYKSDNTTPVFQGKVGLSNASMVLADVEFIVAGTVDIDSFTFTVPAL